MFSLQSPFSRTPEQEKAMRTLVSGIRDKVGNQVLLGVTGSGKTFTIANVIEELQQPALIISHNKTLAGQLYQEMHEFFPDNAVSYFVSYYDYYQPEAYIPQSDTYIEKEAQINDLIDKLRLEATSNILTKKDVIVVASVSCIYNLGSPIEYGKFIIELKVGDTFNQKEIFSRLIELQYERSEFDFKRGTFRSRGSHIDIYPAYADVVFRVAHEHERITSITTHDPLTGKSADKEALSSVIIYPAKHYLIEDHVYKAAEGTIMNDLKSEAESLRKRGKNLEAERLVQKVSYDLEMMREMGYVNGIENYSRYFDGRNPGDPPFSLLDYFNQQYGKDWLIFIDESHMTVPQIRGMYNGDNARKKTLIEYGFRLQASLDNRPLTFNEFYSKAPRIVYISATPNEWEIDDSQGNITEQLVRPTGIIDPEIIVKPTQGDIEDLISEIEKTVQKNQRILVTTLTKRTAEDLTRYLCEKGIKAIYLHSDVKTLERTDILIKLRKQEYDVLVGVNLLREGLDLPEVTLVAILDGDKEGFLRSKTSLIQTMGRAARNIDGKVIVYADKVTRSMRLAIDEVSRRREYQLKYNLTHKIVPSNISKEIRDNIVSIDYSEKGSNDLTDILEKIDRADMTPMDRKKTLIKLKREMKSYADSMDFESAILVRDKIRQLS